ncbi:MAG: hypothetical protein JNN28_04830 [Saprospiraceae bacterium]|nr:hypothetical protein [Saprospiraceae bacterium]
MKYFILVLLFPTIAAAQKTFVRSKIEILESYEGTYKNFWTGEKQGLKVALVHLIQAETSKKTVSFEVTNKQLVGVGTATGISISSALDAVFSRTEIKKNEYKKGVFEMSESDFLMFIDFLNESIAIKASQKPTAETSWQLLVENRFLIALIYKQIGASNWFYLLRIDDAAFEVSYEEALVLMQKLGAMKKIIAG